MLSHQGLFREQHSHNSKKSKLLLMVFIALQFSAIIEQLTQSNNQIVALLE